MQVPDPASSNFHAKNIVIYHVVTIGKSEKKKFLNSVSYFPLYNRDYEGLLKYLKERSFYKIEKDYYKSNFARKESSYYEFWG